MCRQRAGKAPCEGRTIPSENPTEEQGDTEARIRELSRRADLALK